MDGEFGEGFRCAGAEDKEDVVFDGVLWTDGFVDMLIRRSDFVHIDRRLMREKAVVEKNETNDYCNKSFETVTSPQS